MPGELRGRSLKPLLERHRPAAGAVGLLGGALRALSLRLERADGADRRPLPLHQGADATSCTIYSAIRTSSENIAAERTPGAPGAARRAGQTDRRRDDLHAPAEVPADARERLQALGYVGAQTDVADGCRRHAAGSQGQTTDSRDAIAPRSSSRAIGSGCRRSRCCSRSSATIRRWPTSGASWRRLAMPHRSPRSGARRLQALHRAEAVRSDAPISAPPRRCFKQRKLEEAREHASSAADVAAPNRTTRSRAAAHELLAKIALAQPRRRRRARGSGAGARGRSDAAAAGVYIDARLLYDQGKYADALPLFEQAIDGTARSRGSAQIAGASLLRRRHARTARALSPRRKREFAAELEALSAEHPRPRWPRDAVSRRATTPDAAAKAIADMLRITPTPECYALAARLYTMFGNRQQADAVRAEARRAFADSRSGARTRRNDASQRRR